MHTHLPENALASIAIQPAESPLQMNPHGIRVACSNCNLRELCMPLGLSAGELERIDDLVASRRKVKRGATLFRNGERFTSLYAIRTGFFKTGIASEDGRDQVTGFQMAGEVIGLETASSTNATPAMPWRWKMPRSASCRLTALKNCPAKSLPCSAMSTRS